jgi:hypothetical protein
MPKAKCIQSFSSGEGIAYENGVEYDVPASTLKANPTYFEKQSETEENKMADTTEDKSADEATEEVTEEATEDAAE